MTTVSGGAGQDKVTLQYPVEYEKDRLKLTDKEMADKYNLNTQGVKDYKIEKTLDQELILTNKNTGHKLFFRNDIEVIEFAKANYMADEPFRAAGKGNNKETYTYKELLKMAKPVGSEPDPVIRDDDNDGRVRDRDNRNDGRVRDRDNRDDDIFGIRNRDNRNDGRVRDGSRIGIGNEKSRMIHQLLKFLLQGNSQGGGQTQEQKLFLFLMILQSSSSSTVR